MRLSCAPTAGTIIFPLTELRVFLAGVLDRVGPRRLNYPAVPVTPPPVFTRSRRSLQAPASSIFIAASAQDSAEKTGKYHYTNVADFILFSDQISTFSPQLCCGAT